MPSTISRAQVAANGLTFATLEAGPADGPLALCLHGFPDTAWGWRHLLPALGDAGYHAVAPFMRGYAPTGPAPDGRYQTAALSSDAIALHGALGGDERAVILGHDWGAIATYGAAAHAPQLWRKVVAAAVPPAGKMASIFFDFDQIKRSFYMFFFQHPLSDMVVGMDDLAFVRRLWETWSPSYRGAALEEDLGHARDAIGDPANLLAAMTYYRHTLQFDQQAPELAELQAATQAPVPHATLYLHGDEDGCMGVNLAEGAEEFLGAGSRVSIVQGAGHFLLLEKPDEVNAEILAFLAP